MTTNTQLKNAKMGKVNFSTSSPGFIYSVTVAILTILAIGGINFNTPIDVLAGDISTTLSTGGIWAVGGIILSSLVFPIWNFVKSGKKFSFANVFGSTLVWVAMANLAISALVLLGIGVPDGTFEAVGTYIATKDWFGLLGYLASTILPTVIRWIKDQRQLQDEGN